MLNEQDLMQHLRPHPDTQELGCWLSQDEIADLLDGLHADGLDRQEATDDLREDLEEREEDLSSVQSGIDAIISSIKKSNLVNPDDIADELAELMS